MDVKKKMFQYDLDSAQRDCLIRELITENIIDEDRFSFSFCRGKFTIKKWGRIKIFHELRKKGIDDLIIKNGLKAINNSTYEEVLIDLLEKKNKTLRESNSTKRKQKLINYLLKKGFEADLIWKNITNLENDNSF